MLTTLHPNDFERDTGRRRIILILHEMEARIRRLEQNIEHFKKGELHLKKDVESIFKTEM